jgi:hypothetical protein
MEQESNAEIDSAAGAFDSEDWIPQVSAVVPRGTALG